MASFYRLAIQKIQSNGPYLLAGWSFGGVVALEIARQLQLDGHLMKHVILLDSYHPKYVLQQSKNAIRELLLNYKIYPSSEEATLVKFEIKQNSELVKQCRFVDYNGRVTLIKALETLPQYMQNGWENTVSPPLVTLSVQCDHKKLFDDLFIEKTAALIKAICDEETI